MFKCKVCAEKDKRAQVLESEIAFLRDLVHPKVDNSQIPDTVQEANGLLDATDKQIEIQTYADSVISLSEEELRERDQLLSGTY